MPRLTKPVDMIARVRMPGSRKLIEATFSAAVTINAPIGISTVISRLSPRRSVIISSTRVCASTIREKGAALVA